MMKILPKTNIDFVGLRKKLFAVSALLILSGIISIGVKGIKLGLDFTGGTMMQVKFNQPTTIDEIRKAMDNAGIQAELQSYTDKNAFAIRVPGKQDNVNDVGGKIIAALNAIPNKTFEKEAVDYVGPAVGSDLSKKAIWAMALSFLGMIIYLAFRFNNPIWGTMGVVGIAHDIFITLSLISLTGRKIDLVMVAALLTIAGYSINDTIVVYDRMRETMRANPRMAIKDLINKSLNETMSRTIMTTATVFIASLILYFFGGEVINDFAFAMVCGSFIGAYSTVSVATPLVYQWTAGGQENRTAEETGLAEKTQPVPAQTPGDVQQPGIRRRKNRRGQA